jgi:hypothetical protein
MGHHAIYCPLRKSHSCFWSARMAVPKFVCEVACASGFASYMDDDVPWDTRSIVQKERLKSIALEKGNLGTSMHATKFASRKKCSLKTHSKACVSEGNRQGGEQQGNCPRLKLGYNRERVRCYLKVKAVSKSRLI